MCGFAGFLAQEGPSDPAEMETRLKHMADAIFHRGPDSDGYWHDASSGIGLAHRRLAIVDLTPAGHQPMHSPSGRYAIAYNGEIYNHMEMRKELRSNWRGHSDTETLLAGFDVWGIEETVKRSIGMFAFAVWDRQERQLVLGRDRVGEKPLYYGWQGSGEGKTFLFGSELKALCAHPAFSRDIDRNALTLLLRHNAIAAPYSIYRNIHKLRPGQLLSVSLRAPEPAFTTYWSGRTVALTGVADPFRGTPEEAVAELETLLKDAVQKQMMSDVPLGAFLSGGIDSSTVVALMQAQSSRPVKTFSIGFHEDGYNEAVYAKAVAEHLKTDHTELYVTPEQAMAVIPRLPQLYDEPFADSSQIPTFLVSQLARQQVTVSLSGDAGDELFCGYTRYQFTSALWGKISLLPLMLRRVGTYGLLTVPPQAWNKIGSLLRRPTIGDKLHKGAGILTCRSEAELYLGLVSHWKDPAEVVIGASEPPTLLKDGVPAFPGLNGIERMMALDMLAYLPDDILVKVDRAAMGVSLESRVPFLDHRVVEFAWRLPMAYKLRNGKTKWALRQVLNKHVPEHLIERPKMGFGVPIDHWLRGPLKDWAESLLDVSRLKREGYFDPVPIRQKWDEHLSGRRNWQYHLWDVLMFQSWLEAR